MYLIIILASCIATTFGSAIVTYDLIDVNGSNRGIFTNDDYMKLNWSKIYQNRSIKIICDGWQASKYTWYPKISEQYMEKGNTILIRTYYTEAVANPNYFEAVKNTTMLGEIIGELVVGLIENYSISDKDIHGIGFSIGSHVVGAFCKYVKEHGYLISRATGLEPPTIGYNKDTALSEDRAKFVDCIHTSAVSSGSPKCTVDFYVNDAKIQSCCLDANNPIACTHDYSVVLFTLSINEVIKFIGTKCSYYFVYQYLTWFCMGGEAEMGDPVPLTITGKYYVKTTRCYLTEYKEMFSDDPFALSIPTN